jgi:hypothetical protein
MQYNNDMKQHKNFDKINYSVSKKNLYKAFNSILVNFNIKYFDIKY